MGIFRRRPQHETVVDDGIEPRRFRVRQIGPQARTIEDSVRRAYNQPNIGLIQERYPETAYVTIKHDVDIQVEAGNALYQSSGELTVPVGKDGLVLGRGRQADIQILDPLVSRIHAKLAYNPKNGYLTIQDLGSTNLTLIIQGPKKWFYYRDRRKITLCNPIGVRLGRGGPKLGLSYRLRR